MNDNIALTARSLTCGHQGQPFVRDLNLDLRVGELSVLFGVNGAGKTTTLLTLSSLLAPIGGMVELHGRPIEPPRTAHRMLGRGLALVPDDRGLFPGLTVDQHLKLLRTATAAALGDTYEAFPQLSEIRGRKAGLLSGGEQQMLSMARALMANPTVLLIDEMSTGLAPMIVMSLMRTIREISDKRGIAILLVEQHVDLALSLADTVRVLAHGETVLCSTANAVRDEPKILEHAYFGSRAAETAN